MTDEPNPPARSPRALHRSRGRQTNAPVRTPERIGSLDVLRGFALLGIPLMNIQSFSMPAATYTNPTAWGDLTGANLAAWMLTEFFANGKFITLFSILFGAGICLFADRIEGRGGKATAVHYRRMGWLLVFGLAHAYFLWIGDILVAYAVCGSLIYPARRRSPRSLLILGLTVFSAGSAISLISGVAVSSSYVPEDAKQEIAAEWMPDAQDLEAEVAAYRGDWRRRQALRAEQALEMHLVVLPFLVWSVTGTMLLGMALYRMGVLSAARDERFYRRLAASGLLIGAPLVVFGICWNLDGDFRWDRSMFFGAEFNNWGRVPMALGYCGLVMLAARCRILPAVQHRIAAMGRMAFTNYILQSVLTAAVFYGHGLGRFGSVERPGQILIALGLGLVQLWLSPLWLRHFAYGPLEWGWRALTYRSWPHFRAK